MSHQEELLRRLANLRPYRRLGRVTRLVGLTIESIGPRAQVGELCYIQRTDGQQLPAEVVGFRDDSLLLMPLGPAEGLAPGSEVVATDEPLQVVVGNQLLGRVLDGLGRPIDSGPDLVGLQAYPLYADPPHPLSRPRIAQVMSTGVRAIDGLLTMGEGQRMGIFAGSGVGKSTLLGMVARNSQADINVIGLIGERGREVREFI